MMISSATVNGDAMTGLFNETKATQAAARLLTLRGGRMSCIKLVKLLYLADREALLRWGVPITGDRFVSLDIGPVPGRICELIQGEPPPNSARIWRRFISDPDHYEVQLVADPGSGELRAGELSLIDEIFEQHGRRERWSLVEYTRALPEWTYPDGSALPIEYRDILRSAGKTEVEISEIEESLDSAALAERVLV
ncbi:MAG: Panacea domain-containing protein [Bryobacteraceae bacterium]